MNALPPSASIPLVLVSCLFAAVRMAGYTEVHVGGIDVFQPFVHIFVGGLFAAWYASGRFYGLLLWLGVGLSLVELACFLLGVGGH